MSESLEDLLEDLDDDDLAELEADFDINNDLMPANFRPREEVKKPMFEQNAMIHKLDRMMKKNIESSKPVERIQPTKTWKNEHLQERNNNKTNETNKATVTRPYMNKKQEEEVYQLDSDEEELLEGIDEQDLIELAAMTNMHGLVTQEQQRAVEVGDRPKGGGLTTFDPVKGPNRRLTSTSDDDTDLDTIMFMEHLRDDSDDLFYIRINNVKLEASLLTEIFEALKSTTKIKHISLAGVGMKDEQGHLFNTAVSENETLETINLESNDLTNETIEPLCEILQKHPSIREFKCSHQKHGLGSRGEEAMARALDKNQKLLKIAYPFKVQSARSRADRCQIRNAEILRQKRQNGEDFYNYKEEVAKRDKHPQPWIKERSGESNARFKGQLAEQKGRMKSVPNVGIMRAESKLRAKENAKPTIDGELASKLSAARKTRGRNALS